MTRPDHSYPLISIITPVYNSAAYIRETIESVIQQAYKEIQYIIDGGSTDGTVDIIKEYEDSIDYWISEPDRGMYDALVKGFKQAKGDIIGYINAGDYYHKCAFSVISKIFSGFPEVRWATGLHFSYNHDSEVIRVEIPFVYKHKLLRSGWYGFKLPFIQQESTFWHRDMLKTADMDVLKSLKYSGDYYLWYCFSTLCDLSIVNSYIGGFKNHPGQLSSDLQSYFSELATFVDKKSFIQLLAVTREKVLWRLPLRFKKIFMKDNYFYYDLHKMKWTKKNI